MTHTQAKKLLDRANKCLDRVSNHYEGIGLISQSDRLDQAGDKIDDVLETLELLTEM